jgi:hypothetical protein
LANLPCGRILVREPPTDESWSSLDRNLRTLTVSGRSGLQPRQGLTIATHGCLTLRLAS